MDTIYSQGCSWEGGERVRFGREVVAEVGVRQGREPRTQAPLGARTGRTGVPCWSLEEEHSPALIR